MKQVQKTSDPIVKPCSLGELANIYGVSSQVMRRWLAAMQDGLGERRGRFYTARQVQLVFEKLGMPQLMHVREFDAYCK